MAKKADPAGETPDQVASVPPPAYLSARTGEVNLVIQSVQDDLKNIKSGLSDAKSDRHSDFVWNVGMFATGFILLGGMIIFGYFRLEDSIGKADENNRRIEILVTKIDAKLDSLQQRLSTAQMPTTNAGPTK